MVIAKVLIANGNINQIAYMAKSNSYKTIRKQKLVIINKAPYLIYIKSKLQTYMPTTFFGHFLLDVSKTAKTQYILY